MCLWPYVSSIKHACSLLSSITCTALQYFSTLSQNHKIFKGKNEYEMCVLIFSIKFVWNISHSKKKWARYDHKYTGCPRRNGQNFGRVFLMLNYTDITQNTYIQIWTVTEIIAKEKCGHLAFPRTVRLQQSCIDLDSAIKAVISATECAPLNAIRQYFITAKYSCAMYSAW